MEAIKLTPYKKYYQTTYKQKIANDEEYKKVRHARQNECHKRLYHECPEYRAKRLEINRMYKLKRKEALRNASIQTRTEKIN